MTRKQLCLLVTAVGWMFCASRGWAQTVPSDGRALQHVFPQFADGKFNDGTFYRSSWLVTSVVSSTTGICDVRLVGMTTTFVDPGGDTTTLGADTITGGGLGGWAEAHTLGTEPFQSGYLTVGCTEPQTAQVTYSFYAANGLKLSEATVFSSPPGTRLQLLGDQREGARLGLAIVNNTAAPVEVAIGAYGLTQPGPLATALVTIPPMSNYARFLNQILPRLPVDNLGAVQIRSLTPISAIGLRYTGDVFTTIPATVLIP